MCNVKYNALNAAKAVLNVRQMKKLTLINRTYHT